MTAPEDFDLAIAASHRALDEIARGDPSAFFNLFSQRDDATLANPFGPPARGRTQIEEAGRRAASNDRDGRAVEFENLAKCVTADLAYILEVERFEAKVGGSDQVTVVALRVTVDAATSLRRVDTTAVHVGVILRITHHYMSDLRASHGFSHASRGGLCQVHRLRASDRKRVRAMPLIQVKLIEGVFDEAQKRTIVERLTDAMVAIEGENMRQVTWVLVEEVKSGHWAIGGQPLATADVKALAAGVPVG